MPIQSPADELSSELQALMREGPGLRGDLLAKAVQTLGQYCKPPFAPLVRSNAVLTTRYFGSWFSESKWNHHGDGGRRLHDHLLSGIRRLCSAL